MEPQYNTQEFIENVRLRILSPGASSQTYDEDQICKLATWEMQETVVPGIMSAREEFFVDYIEFPTPADGVIEIPSESVPKIRSIVYVPLGSPFSPVNIPRLGLDVISGVAGGAANLFNTFSSGGFYIQGNKIMIWPTNFLPLGIPIRVYFYRRALVLAQPSSYGRVTAIDPMTNTVSLDKTPRIFTQGSQINAISSKPNFAMNLAEATIVTLSFPQLVLDTVEGLQVGDYITIKGYSAIPQIPVEAMGYLAQLTGAKMLEGLGDRPGMEAALAKAATLFRDLLTLITQRVDGSPKKIVNPDGGILTSSSLGYGRFGRGRAMW